MKIQVVMEVYTLLLFLSGRDFNGFIVKIKYFNFENI